MNRINGSFAGERNWRQILLHILSHVLVLVWMYVIFGFSAQNGESSGGLSEKVCLWIVNIVNDFLHMGWGELQLAELVAVLSYPVRKLAHMTEFGILAMLFYWALGFYPKIAGTMETYISQSGFRADAPSKKKRYLFAFFLTVIYAGLDEFHQLFIPDRSGNLFDVCVDSTGALLALLFVWGVSSLYRNYKGIE